MLILRGAIELALHWLKRSAASATARFALQAERWLLRQPDPRLRAADLHFAPRRGPAR